MSVLPHGVPAPRELTSHDDGGWVALVLEDVDGRRPDVPWQQGDVDPVSVALGQLAMDDFRIQDGPDAHDFLRAHAVTGDVEPVHLRSVVACMVGGWAEYAGHPPPPGLPTIRSWQAHCRDHALRWLDDGALWS